MLKVFGKLISIILCTIAIALFCIGLATKDIGVISLSVFCAWGMAIFTAIGEDKRNIIYIFFLITFFIFLLSRVMVRWLQGGEIYSPFNADVMTMVYTCLFVSLFGLNCGTVLKKKIIIGRLGKSNTHENSSLLGDTRINISLVRQLSGAFTIVSGFATLLVVLERIAYWNLTKSGGELRVSFTTTLPSFVLRFSYIYIMMLCIYLATLPAKRKCMPILFQFLAVGALKMVYGSRADFVVGLMFVLIYFVIRDGLNKSGDNETTEIWFGKGEKLFTAISIPVLIILLVFIGYYRRSTSFEFGGFWETLIDFFEAQGTTINVIGYTNVYKEGFTQPRFLYLIDRTYEFITANPISSIITGRHAYLANTIERAKYGTSLGMTLYYNINQMSYLAGYGCGSSYIAEAWLGYGYVGLFIINFFLARIMKRLNEYRFNRFIPSVIFLIYIQSLFSMPRAGFDSFIDDIASVTNIIAIIMLWMLYKMIDGRKRLMR